MIRPSLIVVAFSETTSDSLDSLLKCLVSVRATAPEAQVLLIEDTLRSGTLAEAAAGELGYAYAAQDDGSGTEAAAVAGLEVALEHGLDALLLHPDVELLRAGWLEAMQSRLDTDGRPAAVVGGRLHTADGLIFHAGYYYSVIRRRWIKRFANVPAEVAEAQRPTLCPVASGLTLIRHETLEAVGLPDPGLEQPYTDLDFCLRVFEAGLECVYEPAALGRTPRSIPPERRDEPPEDAARRRRLESRFAVDTLTRFIPDVI